jgi:hypothetical protein
MKYKDKHLINESAEPHQPIGDLAARETTHKQAEFVSNVYLVDHERSLHMGQ